MEEKIGAGGKNQPYEKSNGQYARTEDSYTDTANSLIIWAKSQNIELPLNSDGSANISKLVEIRKEKEPPVNLEGNNRFRRNTSAYFSSLTKKQAGVIFAANKNGNITLPDAAIKYMYRHFVDVRGYNNNHNVCYMAELDPKYCDVILKRYINIKGSSEDVYRLNADGTRTKYSELN